MNISERSARRWEKMEGLPVHRHQHQKRDSVYAYKEELDAWWSHRGPRLAEQQEAETPRRRRLAWWASLLILAVILAGAVYLAWQRQRLFGPAAKPITSLAVLPLENLSGDPDQDYFAEGMTEALISELSKISALKVISRTSVMQYKGVKRPLPEIAGKLGVEGVIEGTVAREGDQVRISVQLLHGPTDRHLWAESYQREIRSVLVLQSELARTIAREIRVQLTPQEQARLASHRRISPDSYEAYLKGYYSMQQFSPAGFQKAMEYFEDAVRQDSNNPLAYAGLALVYGGMVPPQEAMVKRRAAAEKALELDDTLGEAHAALAGIKFRDWDFAGAEKEFQRAIELSPSYGEAHHRYSHLLAAGGRLEESLREAQHYVEVDPLSPVVYVHLGWHYHVARHYDQAIEEYRKALQMDPNFIDAHYRLGEAYLQKARYDEGIAALQKAAELGREPTSTLAELVYAYGVAGRKAEANKALGELLAQAKRTHVSPYDFAKAYTGLGETQLALKSLEKAYEEPSNYEMLFLKLTPEFDSLRSHPRFQDLLRRMNVPEN